MRWSSQRSLKFDGSGNPVVFSVAAASGRVCRVSGTTVTYTASGRCVIDANQADDGSYAAAPHVQQTVIVVDIPRNSGVSSSHSELCGCRGPRREGGSRCLDTCLIPSS